MLNLSWCGEQSKAKEVEAVIVGSVEDFNTSFADTATDKNYDVDAIRCNVKNEIEHSEWFQPLFCYVIEKDA